MGKLQVTVDCADPGVMTRFWALALGYRLEDPPEGFTDWKSYWLSIGEPEDELEGADDGPDSIVDPEGVGPRIWFQIVPEAKVVKNRLHFDVDAAGGRRVPLATRKERIGAEVDRLIAAGATQLRVHEHDGSDHYGVLMHDPEGNEFCLH